VKEEDAMERRAAQVTTTRDADRAIGTITVAFVADPAMRWIYPDPSRYLVGFPKLVGALGQGAFEKGTAHEASEFAGVALWLRPGVQPDPALLGRVIEATVDPRQVPRLIAVLEALDRWHPPEPHWYLPFIGVDTPRQRTGLGSELLRHALEEIDAEHAPAYLETANPGNVPLYRRHGFELATTLELPSAPPLFPMVRPAR
jgi:ribosomal protein S18 acetylase RimI-like enzyme